MNDSSELAERCDFLKTCEAKIPPLRLRNGTFSLLCPGADWQSGLLRRRAPVTGAGEHLPGGRGLLRCPASVSSRSSTTRLHPKQLHLLNKTSGRKSGFSRSDTWALATLDWSIIRSDGEQPGTRTRLSAAVRESDCWFLEGSRWNSCPVIMSLEEVSASFAWLKVDVVQLADAPAGGKSYFKVMSGSVQDCRHTVGKIFSPGQTVSPIPINMNDLGLRLMLMVVAFTSCRSIRRDLLEIGVWSWLLFYCLDWSSLTHTVIQFKNALKIFPRIVFCFQEYNNNNNNNKKTVQTLQHELMTHPGSRANTPEAVEPFSKGFGSILSSACEENAPKRQMDRVLVTPRTRWGPFVVKREHVLHAPFRKKRLSTPANFKGPILHRGEPLPNTFFRMSMCEEPRMRKALFCFEFHRGEKNQFKDICLEFSNIFMF